MSEEFLGLSYKTWESAGSYAMWIAFILALLAALVSFFSSFILNETSKISQGKHETSIAALNKEAAEFKARALEAELKLEQLRKDIAPRRLDRIKFTEALAGAPKAKVEIMYLGHDPECFDLAQQIQGGLKEVDWEVISIGPIPQDLIASYPGPAGMAAAGQPSGVTVATHSPSPDEIGTIQYKRTREDWIETPWNALNYALTEALGRGSASAGSHNAPPKGILRVIVSPKPILN